MPARGAAPASRAGHGEVFRTGLSQSGRLWEAVSPDPCLYPHRREYNWLWGIYVAHRRRQHGIRDTYGELSAKTTELIEENTTFVELASSLPVLRIDEDYAGALRELPTAADKAAAIEAMLTAELTEGDPGFVYKPAVEELARSDGASDR